eukprot:30146-Eustigmatos_ZCMA.PRE.1
MADFRAEGRMPATVLNYICSAVRSIPHLDFARLAHRVGLTDVAIVSQLREVKRTAYTPPVVNRSEADAM